VTTPATPQASSSGPAASPPIPSAAASAAISPPIPSASSSAASAASAVATPPAPPSLEPPPPPPAFLQAIDAANKAIAVSDFATADKQLEAAAATAGDDAHLAYLLARVRALRFAYAGDFDRAAGSLFAVIPTLARHPELPDEFWSHNAMMMIREAQGDPAAALAEYDQATLCATRGVWDARGRDTLAFQKDRWHRAYLTRMLAESRAGSAREALVQYARAALDEYRARGGFPDSVAVLDAYFAALDGKRDEALAAAKRVDPAKDDDLEDLYLVVVGLEAGGDRTAAEAVRRVMRQSGGVHLARAIMLRWLDLDAKGPRAHGFTPWQAAAPSASGTTR
jgi:tetratricopeptide (TPR) repeat protein